MSARVAAIVLMGTGANARAAVGVPTCGAYTVDRTVCAAGCTDTDVDAAVGAALTDDVICVASGTYTDLLTIDGKRVVVVEADAATVTITHLAGGGAAFVDVRNGGVLELVGVTVSGTTLRPCLRSRDAGSSIVLDGAVVETCTSPFDDGPAVQVENGGALETRNGTVFRANGGPGIQGGAVAGKNGPSRITISATTFDGNEGDEGGAVWVDEGELVVTDSTFTDNVATDGGAIHAAGTAIVTVADSTFDQNVATDNGGGIFHASSGDLAVLGSDFEANVADADLDLTGDGGAIHVEGLGGALVDSCAFDGNAAEDGGAIDVDGSEIVLLRSTFCHDAASDDGGAVNAGALGSNSLVASNVFQDLTADEGGALNVEGSLTIRNNTFLSNDAATGGDGVDASLNGLVTLENNLFGWHPGTAARSSGAATMGSRYNAWWSNAVDVAGFAMGVSEVTGADPLLVDFTDDGACDDLAVPLVGSPLVDAGNPAFTDPDGSPSDIGAYGGPDAPSLDVDGDGALIGTDCDDGNAAVNPFASEAPCNGIDDDCDALTADDPDADADTVTLCGGDCDDGNVTVSPLAAEATCNALDDDCDPLTADDPDADADGFTLCGGDCDDGHADVFPGAADPPGDGTDGDCDGADEEPTTTDPTDPNPTDGTGLPAGKSPDAAPGAFVPHGCGCGSTGSPGGAVTALALLLRARRRPCSR